MRSNTWCRNPGLLDDAKPIDARGREAEKRRGTCDLGESSQLRATEWNGSFGDATAYGRNWMAFYRKRKTT